MPHYNPKNERIKKEYFRYQKEAGRKADGTIDAIRKAISRYEIYTGYKDFATFNKEQAIGFKKQLAKTAAPEPASLWRNRHWLQQQVPLRIFSDG